MEAAAEEEGESLAERPEVKSGGDLDVPWMLEHAKQVLKMLPGQLIMTRPSILCMNQITFFLLFFR